MAASEQQTVLQFATPSSSTLSAKVHPLVIFNICDCYVRRPDQAERVIGTLLGSVLPDGTVDILDILKTTMVDKIPSDLEGMEVSMQRLLALIDGMCNKVDDVVEGRAAADNNIGWFISDTVTSLPKLSPPVFDKL